jgi:hypothetical protein
VIGCSVGELVGAITVTGCCVGGTMVIGCSVGELVGAITITGCSVGGLVGPSVGVIKGTGFLVGIPVGSFVGVTMVIGCSVGELVGATTVTGCSVGGLVGPFVGETKGTGFLVGTTTGSFVGNAVGCPVGLCTCGCLVGLLTRGRRTDGARMGASVSLPRGEGRLFLPRVRLVIAKVGASIEDDETGADVIITLQPQISLISLFLKIALHVLFDSDPSRPAWYRSLQVYVSIEIPRTLSSTIFFGCVTTALMMLSHM